MLRVDVLFWGPD